MTGQSVIVVGCGIAGIAVAYYLTQKPGIGRVLIIDQGQPMALTSAQSGENYRNWWPHPVMTRFTDLSISLMEDLARETDNGFKMTRRGYALATRRTDISDLVSELHDGYADASGDTIRFFETGQGQSYVRPSNGDWSSAPGGVDVLTDKALIRQVFPSYDTDVASVLHIRRAGDVDSHQLGTIMLAKAREAGAERITGLAADPKTTSSGFSMEVRSRVGVQVVEADLVINAAGPFIGAFGSMLGYDLPVVNVRQQKVAFEDRHKAIPRDMPFSIDLDPQTIDWASEESELLSSDPETSWLTEPMPGAIHCKAEGGEHSNWIKLGWAYTRSATSPTWEPDLDDHFPEVVLRGAARLNPALRQYYGRLPRQMNHYCGYYTMTAENWPLIGQAGPDGSYVVGALSGFGTMAACASGFIAANLITEGDLPDYAAKLGLSRSEDAAFVAGLKQKARASVL